MGFARFISDGHGYYLSSLGSSFQVWICLHCLSLGRKANAAATSSNALNRAIVAMVSRTDCCLRFSESIKQNHRKSIGMQQIDHPRLEKYIHHEPTDELFGSTTAPWPSSIVSQPILS